MDLRSDVPVVIVRSNHHTDTWIVASQAGKRKLKKLLKKIRWPVDVTLANEVRKELKPYKSDRFQVLFIVRDYSANKEAFGHARMNLHILCKDPDFDPTGVEVQIFTS